MRTRTNKRFILLCLLPALCFYVLVVIVPTIAAFYFGFTKWDGFNQARWVGLEHYAKAMAQLVSGGVFRDAFLNTIFIAVVPMGFILALSLFFAYVLHRGVIGAKLFRVVFFFPNVISFVAICLLWRLIYEPTPEGMANQIVALFGFEPVVWLQHSDLLKSIVPMVIWTSVGFFMVLFLAAMQGIPESLYEAARIDGAGNWRSFWRVTLPLILDTVAMAVVFLIIGGLKFFDMVWVLTAEMPTPETHTMATLFYQKAFKEFSIGEGTAISVMLFLMVFVVSVVAFKAVRRGSIEY